MEIKKNQNKQARLLTVGGRFTTTQSQAEKTQVKDEKVTKAGKKRQRQEVQAARKPAKHE